MMSMRMILLTVASSTIVPGIIEVDESKEFGDSLASVAEELQ